MRVTTDRTERAVPGLLSFIVATQIVYVALSNSGADINRPLIWSMEALAFMSIAVLALVAVSRAGRPPIAWAAIAISGVLNTVQVGIGLAMFGPLAEAGEAMAPVYQAVVAGAFFLYFAGKVLFGCAAVAAGVELLRGTGFTKAFGMVTILAGLAAMAVNLAAMATGMTLVFPAGAAGTVATVLLAIALGIMSRNESQYA